MDFDHLLAAKEMPDNPLYHPQEAADLLGVTRTTINCWCRSGRLVGLKAGKHWKCITRDSLKAFVEGGRHE